MSEGVNESKNEIPARLGDRPTLSWANECAKMLKSVEPEPSSQKAIDSCESLVDELNSMAENEGLIGRVVILSGPGVSASSIDYDIVSGALSVTLNEKKGGDEYDEHCGAFLGFSKGINEERDKEGSLVYIPQIRYKIQTGEMVFTHYFSGYPSTTGVVGESIIVFEEDSNSDAILINNHELQLHSGIKCVGIFLDLINKKGVNSNTIRRLGYNIRVALHHFGESHVVDLMMDRIKLELGTIDYAIDVDNVHLEDQDSAQFKARALLRVSIEARLGQISISPEILPEINRLGEYDGKIRTIGQTPHLSVPKKNMSVGNDRYTHVFMPLERISNIRRIE